MRGEWGTLLKAQSGAAHVFPECFQVGFVWGRHGGGDRDGRIKLIFTALISNLSKGMQLNRNNLKQEYSAFP